MNLHHPYLYKDWPHVAAVGDWIGEVNMSLGQTASYRYPNLRINKGDLLVIQASQRTSANTFTTPSGWTLIVNDIDAGNFFKQSIWYRVADGTEVPNSTHIVGITGTNTTHIRAFRCLLIPNGSNSIPPNEASGLYNTTDLWKPSSITTTGRQALAITFRTTIVNAESALITGQTGGTWEKPFTKNGMVGSSFSLAQEFQVAQIDNPGTISGGSATASGLQIVRSMAFKTHKY